MAVFNMVRPLKTLWPFKFLLPPKVTGTFRQEVLYRNEDIYHRIAQELRKAHSQVLVATAWFTDRNLFDILKELSDHGVDVRLIIGDLDDNTKLPFNSLVDSGATVRRIKRSGHGSMNQKFCVIDQQLAIHGSYNWTNNARKSNQESVIVTTLQDTVQSLIAQYREIEADQDAEPRTLGLGEGALGRKETSEKGGTLDGGQVISPPDSFKAEYAQVLDRMVAAEVAQFDRELLRSQGYERAKACNADPQMLDSAMDTVYSVFINDINIIEDKKKRLIGKIQEQKAVHGALLESRFQKALQSIDDEQQSKEQETSVLITNLKAQAEVCNLERDAIKEQQLAVVDKEEREIEEKIREIDRESLVPRFKWYEFTPVAVLSFGLLCYLVLFYSSAVYILLFSADQARNAQTLGEPWQTPQVFEPKAFSYILKEGAYAISFVCLFVCLPLGLSLISRLSSKSFLGKSWVAYSFALLLDAGIAYKVAAAVHEANYLAGNTSEVWQFTMAFKDSNFFLVFLLGSVGLMLFGALFNRLFSLLEERNPDIGLLQLRLRRSQEEMILSKNRERTAVLRNQVNEADKELVRLQKDLSLQEIELPAIARAAVQRREQCTAEVENDRKALETTTSIYAAHIENDILPISLDSMKDRINVFLEGWTDFANDEYAVAKAVEKSKQAVATATAWQQERLSQNRIDNRIKAL